jgi:hypothetical protein
MQPIYKHELSPSGQERSQPMSHEQFGAFAAKGQAHLDSLKAQGTQPNKMGDETTHHAYEATREPWGGATYNPRTGNAVNFHEPDKHSVSAREPGSLPVATSAHMNEEQFGRVMNMAKVMHHKELSTAGHYLGVFHDADTHKVEIDPVVVTGDSRHREDVGREKALQVAAATHAEGGAYHFASGNGVFPPHVKED